MPQGEPKKPSQSRQEREAMAAGLQTILRSVEWHIQSCDPEGFNRKIVPQKIQKNTTELLKNQENPSCVSSYQNPFHNKPAKESISEGRPLISIDENAEPKQSGCFPFLEKLFSPSTSPEIRHQAKRAKPSSFHSTQLQR